MKKIVSMLFAVVMAFSLSACVHHHTWVDATCITAKTCSECGETEGEALGHNWVDATCTEPEMCSVCVETKGDPLGHIIEKWSVEKEATCTAEGEKSGICTRCNATVKQEIPQIEHTPGEWTVTKNPTSTEAGEKTQSCIACGQVLATEEFTLTPEEIEAQYKASCTAYDYETIARNPDEYMLTYGKYTGEIIQVLESEDELQMRVNITKGSYGYTDTIFVMYAPKDGESRLLEGDIITLYGINMSTISYESIFGATITLPCVYAEYIDLN